MAISHSAALKNGNLDSGWRNQFNNGLINIYAGTVPANADAALSGNTLLGTLTLAATAFGAASGGVSTAAAIASDTSADATGTATFFRVILTGDAGGAATTEKRLQGTITATGGGGDMTLNSVAIQLGGTISLSSFTMAHPA